MTARKAVADDVLGQITRRYLDLIRRVMQGTLDPDTVLKRLQEAIEDRGCLPVETWPMTVSDIEYTIIVNPKLTIEELFLGSGRKYYEISENLSSFTPKQKPGSKPYQTTLRLVQFKDGCQPRHAIQFLRNAGWEPANPWEMLAFLKTPAIVDEVRGSHGDVYYILTPGTYKWIKTDTLHEEGYVYFEGPSDYKPGWKLRLANVDPRYPQHGMFGSGTYVPVKRITNAS